MTESSKVVGMIAGVVIFIATAIFTAVSVGINDGGHRTVVQFLGGEMETVFGTGMYGQYLGKTTKYKDVLTFDFDKVEGGAGATVDQLGVSVQYQDGGMGKIYGILRVRLPSDQKTMIKAHNEFRSNEGLAYKLIKPYTESIMNDTAGLMSSEESYAEKRGTLTQWVNDQLRHGKYLTVQEEIVTVEAGWEYCLQPDLNPEDTKSCKDVRKTRKMVPVIAYGMDGKPKRVDSDIAAYGLTVAGFEITDRTYEKKTMQQISAKREATMAIITSKANAERAKQDTITSEQQGLANVKIAQYEEEVIKQKAVVVAERIAEVAVIAATQKVDVAAQGKLQAEQLKLAAAEYEQEQILRGKGDASYKRQVMEADGALQQKLDTYRMVNSYYADAIAKQKWVPEISMGGSDTGSTGNSASALLDLFMTKTAKDLSLDMKIKQ